MVVNKFEIVKRYLDTHVDFESFIRELFPNGYKLNSKTYRTGDFNDSKPDKLGGSLSIDLERKIAFDFNTGEKAGDLIAIYAMRYGKTNIEALNDLIEKYDLYYLFEKTIDINNKETKNYASNNCDSDNHTISSIKKKDSTPPINSNRKNHFHNDSYNKNNYVNKVFNGVNKYKEGDDVHTYLKNRNINKYNDNVHIYINESGQVSMINICYKFKEDNGYLEKTTQKIGFQETTLTKNADGSFSKTKKQWCLSDSTIRGNPFVLNASGKNNGAIYITEGVENALSLRECGINNEIWCSLSIVNFYTLPFRDNVHYIFFLDNDYKKEDIHAVYSEDTILKLKKNNIDIVTEYDEETNQTKLIYNEGAFSLKNVIDKLIKLNNKHISYIIPKDVGYDANDLLKEEAMFKDKDGNIKYGNRLEETLENTPPIPIEIESSIKITKNGEYVYWKPEKPHYLYITGDKLAVKFAGERLEYKCSDIAIRFALRFGDLYRKVDGIGVFKYNADKGIYIKDNDDANLYADIETTIELMYFEYFFLLTEDRRKAFKKFWEMWNTCSDTKIKTNVVNAIKMSNLIETTEADDFDNDDLLNFTNGVYNLKIGKLYPHSKKYLLTKKLDVNYLEDLDISNPYNDWNKFLTSMFCEGDNDEKGMEKIRFLQKAMGYTFGSSTREEKLFIIKGVTRSGKSTFLETIKDVMNDYCGDTQTEDFITQQDQANNYTLGVLASLQGKRFLHISEISNNKRLNGSQIKRLTGDQYVTGKYLYEKSFSYKNQTKYWIGTNSVDFSEFDDSVKTKLIIIDFDKRFYDAGTEEAIATGRVIDKTLKTRLLNDRNKEIIVKWIVDGFALYMKEGLNPTKDMLDNLDEMETYNNSLGLFLRDNLEKYEPDTTKLKGARKSVNDIYDEYVKYECETFNVPQEQVMSFKRFMKELRNRQFHTKRIHDNKYVNKKTYLIGWCLKEEIYN